MKLNMKKIIVPILAVVVIGLGVLILNLGSAAKGLIEKIGSETLGTKVEIASVDVSIPNQSVVIEGVHIHNPEGFKSKSLLKISRIDVKASNLMGDPILIDRVNVDGTWVTYEISPKHGTNIGVIKSNLVKHKSAPTPERTADQNSEAKGKQIAIKRLNITNSNVTPAIEGQEKPIALPDLRLNNIGTENNPATSEQVVTTALNAVMKATTTAIAKAGLAEGVSGAVKEGLGKVDNKLKGLFGK